MAAPAHCSSAGSLVARLRWLAGHMRFIAADMCYYGGFGPVAQAGVELTGAANIAEAWASAMEKGLRQ